MTTTATPSRRYLGLTVVPNSDNSGAAPGYRLLWRADCSCGWSTRCAYQSEVRQAIRSHKYQGWPVACTVSS